MGKALIIAEKPSVASDIAKALGGFKKKEDFFESDDFVLCSAVGHLLELCLQTELDGKKIKWGFASLPIIPDEFALRPIAKSEARLKLLKKLMIRKDVDSLVNACDAGREGELIFRYIVKHVKSIKPIRRLWLQSMTPTAIRDGFAALRPGVELEPLAQAAVCRSESDWLVGINGTRALTAFNSKNGGFQLTTVGRVQTPTLAIVVERELKIKNFISKGYWEIHGNFTAAAGEYPGRWFDETFKKADKDEDPDAKAERIWDEAKAAAIAKKCMGKTGVVTEEKKPSSQLSPMLYDLTSLQRDGNSRLGLSAKRTLQIAQSLYERHKVLTYPRTDSRCLPEDYVDTVKQTLKAQNKGPFSAFSSTILKNDWVKPSKRIFNNAKVSDHFAIIPTTQVPENLDEIERKVYEMVLKRFLAVFYPAAQFEITTRITRVENEPFRTDGKILREPGWLAIYGREEEGTEDTPSLVPVENEEKVKATEVESRGLMTRPPARYTEATLLSAMEGAGKLVEDEELREAMASKGLGTPATRAAIIEGLLLEQYLQREGRDLIATPKALALIELLEVAHIPGLSAPEMTGEWEFKLKQIEKGDLSRDQFMKEIVGLTREIVEKAKTFEDGGLTAKPFSGKSPLTGAPMVETLRAYQTEDGAFQVRKVVGGRILEPEEALQLIDKKFIGPLEGFRSRFGKPFSAALKLTEEGKVEFVFSQAAVNADGSALDLSTLTPIGVCPVDSGKVYETLMAYSCEHSLGEVPTCKFRIGKKILGKDIPPEQVTKLLNEKKTDLLPGFWSQRTKRPFSAFLVLQEEGKIGFEFPPRAAAADGAKPRGKKPFKKSGPAKA